MPYSHVLICSEKHVVNDLQGNVMKYCQKCGNKLHSECQNCGAPILGPFEMPDATIVSDYEVPYYCHNCGEPYPWTQKILDDAVELLALDSDLDSESKELIRSAIPGLIVDSPTAPLSVEKFNRGISKVSANIKNGLFGILKDVIVESVASHLIW